MPIDSKLGAPISVASANTPTMNVEAWAEQVESLLSLRSSRGPVTSLVIPIDEQPPFSPADAVDTTLRVGTSKIAARSRPEPLRRDSLKRREALVKGNEGSRRRQRWENDRLLNNPWAQPPLPTDWEVHPTYPKHTVPYYLAPLWDENSSHRQEAEKKRRETIHTHVGNQTDARSKVPKELRQKLKKAKAAKGLLQVLEEEVRKFIKTWEEKTHKEEPKAPELDSEDEEIVFIGRNGHMHDVPPSPEASFFLLDEDNNVQSDHLVFDSMADDHGASFGRWLVHSIGAYYGLRTWSITVGDPARREAYVSIDSGKCVNAVIPAAPLPRPLWGMV